MTLPKPARIAVVGSGPAGLMAAFVLSRTGAQVSLFEKRKGLGRKLLVAGSSGLNITYDAPAADFSRFYTGPRRHFERIFETFSPEAWRSFIERDLAIPTFKGTSRRYFVEGMKASQLLKGWTEKLKALGVEILTGYELNGIETGPRARLHFLDQAPLEFDAACLALGGGSWEPDEAPLRWVEALKSQGLKFTPFESANCGYEVDWPPGLLEEAEGKPIKNIVLSSSKGRRSGELVITRYGLEGTPIYFAGSPGVVHLDLKPDLDERALYTRLSSGKENLSPIRRIKKFLKLGDGAQALIFHLMPDEVRNDLKKVASHLKQFPIQLKAPRPLAEAISSSGGLAWEEVTDELMLRKFPGFFVAGEMLDWHAPTGGFLIQASVSEGYFAGQSILRYLKIP